MNMLIRFFILMKLLQREFDQQQKSAENKGAKLQGSANETTEFEPFSKSYRVLPHDMGFRNHLPNYRYLSFIELNITGWLTKCIQQKNLDKLEWIISMQEMVYLKEIKLWNKMTVSSRLEGWDAKYLYFQHHFYVKDSLMAIGLTKFVLIGKDSQQSPEVLGLQGHYLTEVITTWNANQSAIKSQ